MASDPVVARTFATPSGPMGTTPCLVEVSFAPYRLDSSQTCVTPPPISALETARSPPPRSLGLNTRAPLKKPSSKTSPPRVCVWSMWHRTTRCRPFGLPCSSSVANRGGSPAVECWYLFLSCIGRLSKHGFIEFGIEYHFLDIDPLRRHRNIREARGGFRYRQNPRLPNKRDLESFHRSVIAEVDFRRMVGAIHTARLPLDLGLQEGLGVDPDMKRLAALCGHLHLIGIAALNFIHADQFDAGTLRGVIHQGSIEVRLA